MKTELILNFNLCASYRVILSLCGMNLTDNAMNILEYVGVEKKMDLIATDLQKWHQQCAHKTEQTMAHMNN